MGAGIASAVAVPLLSSCTGTSGSAASSTTSAAAPPARRHQRGRHQRRTSAAGSSASSAAGSTASSAASSIAKLGGTVSFGSNASDDTPKKAYQAVFDAFNKLSGTEVKVNTVDHNSFQENINNYLQGSPDEVFTWFAGNRMQFFAAQGLLTPIDEVWAGFQDQYSDAFITGVDRGRRQEVLRAVLQLPVGVLLPEECVRGQGLRPSRRPSTS